MPDSAAADRFEAWCGSIAAPYQAAPLPTAGLAQFSASVKAHHLGQVVAGQTDVGAYRHGACDQ